MGPRKQGGVGGGGGGACVDMVCSPSSRPLVVCCGGIAALSKIHESCASRGKGRGARGKGL